MIKLPSNEDFVCAWHHAKCFAHFICSSGQCSDRMIASILQMRNWRLRVVSCHPQGHVAKPVRSRAQIGTHTIGLQRLCFQFFPLLPALSLVQWSIKPTIAPLGGYPDWQCPLCFTLSLPHSLWMTWGRCGLIPFCFQIFHFSESLLVSSALRIRGVKRWSSLWQVWKTTCITASQITPLG